MSRSRELVVCRCEEVTVGDVQDAVRAGCRTLQEVKMATRAGMGPCQGRVCRTLLERLASLEAPPAGAAGLTKRLPVYPVPLGQLEEEGQP